MPEPIQQKIALLLMAAGSSSRLGQPKQFVKITETNKASCSLLSRQVTMMESICSSTNAKAYCVLGFESESMRSHLASCTSAQHLILIDNLSWSQGLSSSIAKGVSFFGNDVSAVLIFLVDQWQVSVENLKTLITRWQDQPEYIHIASYNNNVSPPVIFPSRFFKELMALNGDDGAKKIIKDNINQVVPID